MNNKKPNENPNEIKTSYDNLPDDNEQYENVAAVNAASNSTPPYNPNNYLNNNLERQNLFGTHSYIKSPNTKPVDIQNPSSTSTPSILNHEKETKRRKKEKETKKKGRFSRFRRLFRLTKKKKDKKKDNKNKSRRSSL
jgi:hypothetical protein